MIRSIITRHLAVNPPARHRKHRKQEALRGRHARLLFFSTLFTDDFQIYSQETKTADILKLHWLATSDLLYTKDLDLRCRTHII